MNSLSFFKFKRNNRILFWLGIQHSQDYTHPQFQELKSKWEDFLKLAQSPFVIVENMMTEVYATEKESILKDGEVGFMSFLAKKASVPIKCFEPDRHEEMNLLAKQFGKEKTEYYYFGRAVAQWHSVIKSGDLEKYILPFLKRDENAANWNNFDFTIANMKQIHRNLFNDLLDLNNKNFFLKIEDPFREDNPLKDIAIASGNYRDKIIIENTKFTLQNHDVFMVYGNGHLEMHKNGLCSYSPTPTT